MANLHCFHKCSVRFSQSDEVEVSSVVLFVSLGVRPRRERLAYRTITASLRIALPLQMIKHTIGVQFCLEGEIDFGTRRGSRDLKPALLRLGPSERPRMAK